MQKNKIQEAKDKTAVMAFGRMNPPTIGHAKLVDAIKSQPGDPYLFLTQTQKPKTDPLDFETKLKFAKQFFPDITIGSSDVRTIVQALQKIEDMGYENVIYVAGSDRVGDFTEFLEKYNEIEPHFESIRVVSAGERDPDAKGAEGMSASKMRELAAQGDFEAFKQGVPKPDLAEELYNTVRQAMGVKEPATESKENTMTTRLLKEFTQHLDAIVGDRLNEMTEAPGRLEDEIKSILYDKADGFIGLEVDIDERSFPQLIKAAKMGDQNTVANIINNYFSVSSEDPSGSVDNERLEAERDAAEEILAVAQQSESTFEAEGSNVESIIRSELENMLGMAQSGEDVTDMIADELADHFDDVEDSDNETLQKVYSFVREKLPDISPEQQAKGLQKALDYLGANENTFEDEYGDEEDDLDSDEPEATGFKQAAMFDQLGKVLDSQDSPKPLNTVTTDDGETFEVTADQARVLRELEKSEKVPPQVRREFRRDIQSSSGLTAFLDKTDYHDMAHLFVKRYLH